MSERGRPSDYTPELAAMICDRLAEGRTLRDVCRDEDMPARSTVFLWLEAHKDFSDQYARARERGYQEMADELLEVADDGTNDWVERSASKGAGYELNGEHVQRSRLRVDTRKWLLSKALPKVYGDRTALEHSGPGGGPIETMPDDRSLARAIVGILQSANTKGEKK